MTKVIERATGIEMTAEAIEGGYQVYDTDGENTRSFVRAPLRNTSSQWKSLRRIRKFHLRNVRR